MPKDQGHFSEWVCHNISKNAKDKSNSATLRASQGVAHRGQKVAEGMVNSGGRMSRCDMEKDLERDSGYSEAGSDSMQSGLDDQHGSMTQPHRKSSKGGNSYNSGGKLGTGGRNMPPYEELTPIYVIKNLVVKPSEQITHRPQAWGGGWRSLTAAEAPAQLLLIQQSTMPSSSSSTPLRSINLADHKAQPKKGGSRCKKSHSGKNSYLPILNSYPRIAPHPRKEGHEQSKAGGSVGGVNEGHSQSKRVCTELKKREVVSTTSSLLKPQQHHRQRDSPTRLHCQCKVRSGHGSFTNPTYCLPSDHVSTTTQTQSHRCHQSSRSDNVGSPSQSNPPPSNSPSSFSPSSSSRSSSVAHSPYRSPAELVATAGSGNLSDSPSESSFVRQRRFHNTAEILTQSGLLAITLRTKELLKQNAATEREIAQLRQHTNLLCRAARAGQPALNDSSNSLEKLLQAMTQSGSYPSLDSNRVKELSNNFQQSDRRYETSRERDGNVKNKSSLNGRPQNLTPLPSIDDRMSPPSPLFAPSPEAERIVPADSLTGPLYTCHSTSFLLEQEDRMRAMVRDLTEPIMSPETSTHDKYLC